MANEQFTIDLGDGQSALLVSDDDAWLRDKLRQEPGSTRIRVRYDGDEVEGHRYGGGLGVRVIADDLDTEGHAIALHFPSREEADAFRKRLMLTGVVIGAVALGTASGVGLSSLQQDAGSAATVSTQATTDANRDVGLMDFGAAAGAATGLSAADQAYADRLTGQAAAAAAAGDVATDADGDIGLMDFGGAAAPSADDDADITGGPSISGPTPR